MKKEAAKVLVVDDDPDVLTAARVVLRQRFEQVDTESNPQRLPFLMNQSRYDVILLDMNFSTGKTSGSEGLHWLHTVIEKNPLQQVVMITAYADIKLAVEAMKRGAADFIVKPWENEKLEATVQSAYNHSVAKAELAQLRSRQSNFTRVLNASAGELVGNSPVMRNTLTAAVKVAPTDANVLLLGENGTGKEMVARFIHDHSNRKDQPFIKVDAGSLSANLFESELFGHRKGAFTDARDDRTGRIELAHGGTLFLDEIGNIPIALQAKLLTVLQNREVTPIGSNHRIPVDIRVISATNIDIQKAVAQNHFREDLLYRINTVEITLPPLRMRTEDIPALVNHFLKMYSVKYRKEMKTINEQTMSHLQRYSWPGNVRELQHAVERAVIMSDLQELSKNDFLFGNTKETAIAKEPLNLDEMERKAIIQAIQKYHGNMSKVAKELGVGRTTLYRKLTKYGLDK